MPPLHLPRQGAEKGSHADVSHRCLCEPDFDARQRPGREGRIARQLAAPISAEASAGTIMPSDNPTPPLAPGKSGLSVQTENGLLPPPGCNHGVVTAAVATAVGSGDPGDSVRSGDLTSLTLLASGGSVTIVGGAGNARVVIPGNDGGDRSINLGNGSQQVLAPGSGSGNGTVSAGSGQFRLGSGNGFIPSSGRDAITAASGEDTIGDATAFPDAVRDGKGGRLFVGGSGPAAIPGGSGGSDTFRGGEGQALVQPGRADVPVARTGPATPFGGGGQALHADVGNETTERRISGPGNDNLVAASQRHGADRRRAGR